MKYSQSNNPKRHKIIRPDRFLEAFSPASIKSMEELKKSLQEALLVEHFTIPPYLCAYYSMQSGVNVAAANVVRSVAVEEMLHMIMVANILNAIGGKPVINEQEAMPQFPNPLPHSSAKYEVNLLKFSKEAINTFLRIEKPAPDSAPPGDKFNSIGQFYASVRKALIRLEEEVAPDTIFTGDPKRQVTKEHYYGSGGTLVAVYSLEDALEAIDEIVGQGEGIDGSITDGDAGMFDRDVELAHYFRFNEVFHEQYYQPGDKPNMPPTGDPMPVDWNAVYNMEPNPKMEKYKDNPFLLEKMEAFNKNYMRMLDLIQRACDGYPNELIQAIQYMHAMKNQAIELMKIPSGHGNYTAGPSFEYMPQR